jgi:hypothetical protein
MALLNPPEYSPQIARFISRHLLAAEDLRCSREQLTVAVAPVGLDASGPDGTPDFKHTLKLCGSIGLVVESNEKVELSPNLPSEARNPRTGDKTFRRTMANLVFDPSQYSEGGQTGCSDFLDAGSWFMTLDPIDIPGTWPEIQALQHRSFGSRDESPIKNDTRWQSFNRWAPFLGLASIVPGGKGYETLIPDPTDAIDWCLDVLLESKSSWDADEFVSALAQAIPVLDRGVFNTNFRVRHGSEPASEDEVSAPLSLALERLELRGRVEILDKADTRKLLRRHRGRKDQQFSDVIIRERKGESGA